MSLFAELKRRNVFRVGIAYAVAAWVILQLTDVIGEIMELPEWGGKLILLLLIAGLPIALIFAWAFELTPEGVKRDKDVDRSESVTGKTGRKLDFVIIGLLAVGLAYFIYEARFKDSAPVEPTAPTEPVTAAAPDEPAPTPATDTAAVEVNSKSIAVLPFTNRSPNQDDIYFTDGVHDDLLTQLAKLDAFSVISRTSVMEYRDTEKKIGDIANELGVANIMEGAVQRAGSQVRINVQLIDAATDEHLWAEVYDRELTTENLFKIQSEIAQAIADALHATLTDEQIAAVAEAPTDNVEAYELYQQARRFALAEDAVGYETAIELFTAALELDPEFKLAYVGLARAHMTNFWQHGGDPADRDAARVAIDKARAIDPDFPELEMAEGFYWYWGYLEYDRAITHLKKALAEVPGSAEAHMWLGWAHRRNGKMEEAIAYMKESNRLDPRVMLNWLELGATSALLKQQEESLEYIQKGFDLDPESYWSRYFLGAQVYRMTGDANRMANLMIGAQHTGDAFFMFGYIDANISAKRFEDALEALELVRPNFEVNRGGYSLKEQTRAWIYALMGEQQLARENALVALDRLKALEEKHGFDFRMADALAATYAALGDQEKVREYVTEGLSDRPFDAMENANALFTAAQFLVVAGLREEGLEMLESALAPPSYPTTKIAQSHPAFESLRDDAAFIALMEAPE